MVLLELITHAIGWNGLSNKRLENADYCDCGAWNSCITGLVVSTKFQMKMCLFMLPISQPGFLQIYLINAVFARSTGGMKSGQP